FRLFFYVRFQLKRESRPRDAQPMIALSVPNLPPFTFLNTVRREAPSAGGGGHRRLRTHDGVRVRKLPLRVVLPRSPKSGFLRPSVSFRLQALTRSCAQLPAPGRPIVKAPVHRHRAGLAAANMTSAPACRFWLHIRTVRIPRAQIAAPSLHPP